MRHTNSALFSTALLVALAPPVLAEKSPFPSSTDMFSEFGEVEDWTIYAGADTKTCLAERVDEVGKVMQMGVTKDYDYAYVGIVTLADIDVKANRTSPSPTTAPCSSGSRRA